MGHKEQSGHAQPLPYTQSLKAVWPCSTSEPHAIRPPPMLGLLTFQTTTVKESLPTLATSLHTALQSHNPGGSVASLMGLKQGWGEVSFSYQVTQPPRDSVVPLRLLKRFSVGQMVSSFCLDIGSSDSSLSGCGEGAEREIGPLFCEVLGQRPTHSNTSSTTTGCACAQYLPLCEPQFPHSFPPIYNSDYDKMYR